MRILVITHFFPPTQNAGTENYTLGLAKALLSQGHDVQVICAEDWDVGDNYWNGVSQDIFDGVPVYRIHLNWTKAGNPNKVLYDSLPVEKWLDEFLANTNVDIVHITSAYSLGVGIFRSVKRAKIPLVLTLTDFWFLCPSIQLLKSDGSLCDGMTTSWQCHSCLMDKSHFFKRMQEIPLPDAVNALILRSLSHFTPVIRQRGFRGLLLDIDQRKKTMTEVFDLPDVIISPSRIVKEIFAKNLPRPIIQSGYGHDLSWLSTYQGKSNSDIIRFGYLGQIQRIKGVHLLVDAFVKAGFGVRARLDIWGNHEIDPEYTQELNSVIKAHETIFLRGTYKRNQLASVLSNIDVVVVPSTWYENAPLVIQEAFATKTPVIVSNIGGMSDFVSHETDGLLFERGNSDDLARQMIRVVHEPGLLEQLSRTMPKVKTFEDEMIELNSIYKDLIK